MPTNKGYTFAIAAALLSGSNYVLGKVVLQDMAPLHLIAVIFTLAAIIQGAFLLPGGRWREILCWSPRNWRDVLLFSLLSVAALGTFWTAVKYLDPTVGAFISRIQTLVAVFLGVYFLQERFRLLEGLGGLFVIGGVIVLYASSNVEINRYFWVMVLSSITFGVTEVVAKIALKGVEPLPLSFIRTVIIAGFYLIWVATQGIELLALGKRWWGVIAIALCGPTLARLFYLLALKYLAVSKTALVNQVQPIFVAAIAFAFLGTIPALREWIGGGLILIGCTAMIKGVKWQQNGGIGS